MGTLPSLAFRRCLLEGLGLDLTEAECETLLEYLVRAAVRSGTSVFGHIFCTIVQIIHDFGECSGPVRPTAGLWVFRADQIRAFCVDTLRAYSACL